MLHSYLAVYDRIEPPSPEPVFFERQVSNASMMSNASTTTADVAADAGTGSGAGDAGAGSAPGAAGSDALSSAVVTDGAQASMRGTMMAPMFVSRLSSRVRRRRQAEGWLPPRIMQAVWRENVG